MLVSESGQCQPLRYLVRHRETAATMMRRIDDVDRNGPPGNPELFKWLAVPRHRGFRVCEYKVHHPRPCRAYAFETPRGLVIARIADKTDGDRRFNETMHAVSAMIDRFLEEGERYEQHTRPT